MKTAVSIPDELFVRAERAARRLRKSRSGLYAEALAEYVARHDPDEVTAAMDRVCDGAQTGSDAWAREATRRILDAIEW